jgi:hypothetical protein
MMGATDYAALCEALLSEVSDAQVLRCDGEPAILFETSAELIRALTRVTRYNPSLLEPVNRFIAEKRSHLTMCEKTGSRVLVMFTSKVGD